SREAAVCNKRWVVPTKPAKLPRLPPQPKAGAAVRQHAMARFPTSVTFPRLLQWAPERQLVSDGGMRYGPDVPPISFETDPSRYRRWRLEIRDAVAVLGLAVDEDAGLTPGYTLKLNAYDLGVDIELADAIQRLRFSHPEVHALVVTSLRERLFSAGANIYMLAASTHPAKVNFCKFTNETRLHLEEMSAASGIRTLAALNGTASGGGYELALACDEILLIDDGSAAVSFPEVPLLGVLPGTGGLTPLVAKRKVRRDRADFVATTAGGVRGKPAADWGVVDEVVPRSEFESRVRERAAALVATSDRPAAGPGVPLEPLSPRPSQTGVECRWVRPRVDRERRAAALPAQAPDRGERGTPAGFLEAGSRAWAIAAWRELDDALLHLRFDEPEIGVVLLRTTGDPAAVLAVDRAVDRHRSHWLVPQVVLVPKRGLKRLELTARAFFAPAGP